MPATRTAIIGAGASGLSLALVLDGDWEIYEAAAEVGGHASTVIRDGWTFDRGPHIMFSKDQEILDFMLASLAGNVHPSRRNSCVCIDGHFAKYPIENDLAGLPDDLRNACLLDFLFNEHRDLGSEPANLYEWFLATFGRALTDLYLAPYNEKVWKIPTAELSMLWAERIPQPPAIDVVKGALGIATEGYVHQLYFHYPRRGGYQAIPQAWAALLPGARVHLSDPVQRIRPGSAGLEVTTRNGTHEWDRVVSTAPLPVLLGMLDCEVPDAVRRAVDQLQVNPQIVVSLGYRGTDDHQFSSVYFPDPKFLVNRISSPCTFSPDNGPAGCYSIQAEVTLAPGDPMLRSISDEEITDHVHDGLVANGIVSADDELTFVDVQRFDYAYIVYRAGYERHLEVARAWLEQQGIYPHGRFGAFEYLNVDGCVRRSVEMATRLNGRPTSITEVRLPEPSTDVA